MNHKNQQVDLSIIITAHAEGILLHKTLLSVEAALEPLESKGIVCEIIIHCDNPSPSTSAYISANKKQLESARIFINSFGDLGSSRNFAVSQAKGQFITFIDADDLMSQQWLIKAYEFLNSKTIGQYVAHSEATVEFGDADSIIIKHGEIDQPTDTLLSVYSNRWNSIIMAPRSLILEEKYTENSPGFGYEDWHLNCRLIQRGVHNVLIPGTVIFVRRKNTGSEWSRQRQSRSVLMRNPLFDFAHIRTMQSPFTNTVIDNTSLKSQSKAIIKRLANKYPPVKPILQKARRLLRAPLEHSYTIPNWLVSEWKTMHGIDHSVFLSQKLMDTPIVYDSLTPEHYQAASAYKSLVDATNHDHYDYLLFVPWLNRGGADSFAINYVNEILLQRPSLRIAVLSTLDTPSSWSNKLSHGIDFIPFGQICAGLHAEVMQRVMEQFTENSGAKFLHVINSEFAYDFLASHSTYIKNSAKKIILTSFSQSTDSTGRVFGYSHTHVPQVYDLAHVITSDNQAVVDMWVNEYGFDSTKLLVHHQPVVVPKLPAHIDSPQFHILWAARLSPEKIPSIVPLIAESLGKDFVIDMYGEVEKDFNTEFLQHLPPNLQYKGSYDGFYSLALESYDAYLYTSLFDGMPNALLEAGAAGIPIVSAAVGGIPSLIDDGLNGLLVADPHDVQSYVKALSFLRTNPEKAKEYARSLSSTLSKDFSQESYRAQVSAFLKKVDLR